MISKIEMKTNCPEGVIYSNKELNVTILGVLPFLSAMCSILLLAELMKLETVGDRSNNLITFENYSSSSKFQTIYRKPSNCNICRGQEKVYPEMSSWNTKYASLL